MNASYVRLLVEFLPEDSVYFRLNGVGGDRPSRLALALNDPKFGWNFLRALNEDGLELPLALDHLQLQEANAYLRGGYNETMDEAAALAGPRCTQMSNLLKGLLISRDVTLEGIARFMKISLDAVRIFDQLFFNVRDRLDEPGYIVPLLNPDGIRVSRDTNNEELLLLRAGFQHGAREVIQLAGFKPEQGGPSLDELRENIEREILQAGEIHTRHGGDQALDSPVVSSAIKLLIANKRNQREETGPNKEGDALMEISVYHPVMKTVQKMIQPNVDRMLELSQQNAAKKPEPGVPG